MGSRVTSKSEKRPHNIVVTMTDEERDTLKWVARVIGKDMSKTVRWLAKKEKARMLENSTHNAGYILIKQTEIEEAS